MTIAKRILLISMTSLVIFAGFDMFQDQLLYFPEKAAQADVISGRLRAWPAERDFRGLVAEPADPVRGTAIVFHGYDSVAHLRPFGQPIVVAIAGRDHIVPARFGIALYKSLTTSKQLKVLIGADHNDWMVGLDENWWREAINFLLGGTR